MNYKNQIIEAIPNISEGRNLSIIESLVDVIRNTEGCKLLDYSSDYDHNRTVITYIGNYEGIEKASCNLIEKACELIDMRKHKGRHPRMGAVDVMPFVPIRNIEMSDCIKLSKAVGEYASKNCSIPVFLYEESASSKDRKKLENIRRGEFEGLYEKIKDEEWKPDFICDKYNEKSGSLIIGARKPLIAFNVLLDTSDVNIAKEISKQIRESSGGMKSVKALGIYLDKLNKAQVSMNLTDYKENGVYEVVEKIRKLAKSYGVSVIESELIGLMPMEAMLDSFAKYINLSRTDNSEKIIESHLL